MLVADGNFKADHVKQKETTDPDVFLADGGGMQPNNAEYFAFLEQAFERYTVSNSNKKAALVMPMPLLKSF